MARPARRKSSINVYHVMLRGINKQVIFEDEEDRIRFLKVLKECRMICGFKLYAYCLMSNHIHLLVKEGNEPLEMIFRRIGARFVYWYNMKYQRTGHLFQGRFKSEAVENEAQFLTTLRYILQNPMKAGLEALPGTYPWSSYHSYAGVPDHLTDVETASSFFQSREEMLEYFCRKNDDSGLEIDRRTKGITDEEAKTIIERVTGCDSLASFQALDKQLQKEYVRRLRKEKLSLGQISRMTGMSKTTISRAIKSGTGD